MRNKVHSLRSIRKWFVHELRFHKIQSTKLVRSIRFWRYISERKLGYHFQCDINKFYAHVECGPHIIWCCELEGNEWKLDQWVLPPSKATKDSENRIITLFGLFENEIGPGELQLTVQKYVCCKKTKGTRSPPLKMFPFSTPVVRNSCLLNAELHHSRSNLVFKIRNHLIFGIAMWP